MQVELADNNTATAKQLGADRKQLSERLDEILTQGAPCPWELNDVVSQIELVDMHLRLLEA